MSTNEVTQDVTPDERVPNASGTRKPNAAKHKRALAAMKSKRQWIEYALENLPRGTSVDDVRTWLGEHAPDVPTRPYTSDVVNKWRAANGVSDTAGSPVITPELAAALQQLEQGDADTQEWRLISGPSIDAPRLAPAPFPKNEARPAEPAEEPVTAPSAAVEATPEKGASEVDLKSVRRTRRFALPWFYLGALVGTIVSGLTSYKFVGEKLGITGLVMAWDSPPLGLPPIPIDLERLGVFAGLEILLIGCAIAMRANVLREGNPGSARTVAWLIAGFSAFAGFSVSEDFTSGAGRFIFGPLLAMVALHLALGLDARSHRIELTGVWAQVARELRERMLSLLGLGNDQRDALARTRDRATLKAARLAVAVHNEPKDAKRGRFAWGASTRDKNLVNLQKALHTSNIAHDPQAKARMLRELAILQNAEKLAENAQPSPW